MTLKNEPKDELNCRLKIDMRNLTNFDSRTQKSQKFTFSWEAFDQSIAKKYREVIFHDTRA